MAGRDRRATGEADDRKGASDQRQEHDHEGLGVGRGRLPRGGRRCTSRRSVTMSPWRITSRGGVTTTRWAWTAWCRSSRCARIAAWRKLTWKTIASYVGDLCDADFTYHIVADFAPDAIVHYAEQRAAPYSMVDRMHAVYTQINNVVGNLNVLYAIAEINPEIHLVKLGTTARTARPTSTSRRGGSTSSTRAAWDRVRSRSGRGRRPPVEGARQSQHRVRLPDLGDPRDRPEPGCGLRRADPGRRPGTNGWRRGSTTTGCSARC